MTEITRLLAIDDDPIFLSLYRMLEAHECDVITADNPAVIEQGVLEKVDLVVLDLMMPGVDGISFLIDELVPRRAAGAQFALMIASGADRKISELARRVAWISGIPSLVIGKPFSVSEIRGSMLDLQQVPMPRTPHSLSRQCTVEELRAAMDKGEIVSYFQPQISVANGHVSGLELLARWEHPEEGVLSPGRFISAADSPEMAVPFALLVLESGLKAIAGFERRGVSYGGRISLNISPLALQDSVFSVRLKEMLDTYGIVPERLVCELTEQFAVNVSIDSLAAMARLMMMGVNISIDDFGKGHSNLDRLTTVAYDELKLDRCLIQGMEDTEIQKNIVLGIVTAAEQAGLRVVGEGVESERDVDLLVGMGCTDLQGFYYSRPVPSNELPALLSGLVMDSRARVMS